MLVQQKNLANMYGRQQWGRRWDTALTLAELFKEFKLRGVP